MNIDFAANIHKIVEKMMKRYNEGTSQYIVEEVQKVQSAFAEDLERKI